MLQYVSQLSKARPISAIIPRTWCCRIPVLPMDFFFNSRKFIFLIFYFFKQGTPQSWKSTNKAVFWGRRDKLKVKCEKIKAVFSPLGFQINLSGAPPSKPNLFCFSINSCHPFVSDWQSGMGESVLLFSTNPRPRSHLELTSVLRVPFTSSGVNAPECFLNAPWDPISQTVNGLHISLFQSYQPLQMPYTTSQNQPFIQCYYMLSHTIQTLTSYHRRAVSLSHRHTHQHIENRHICILGLGKHYKLQIKMDGISTSSLYPEMRHSGHILMSGVNRRA